MLYATKGSVTLHVSIVEGNVCITAKVGGEENSRLPATIARNEELLARIDLKDSSQTDYQQHLVSYFIKRGWTIQQLNTPPSDSYTVYPASHSTR